MVISHKHRYLFVEVPRTGSTAVSNELCEVYDGERILRKHAHYIEFLKVANHHEKKYFVFQGKRNPLDDIVSNYFKLKNNHCGNFTNLDLYRSQGGWIGRRHLKRFEFIRKYDADFPAFFKRFYKIQYLNPRVPYFTPYDWPGRNIRFTIRFESLLSEFERALKVLHLQPKRPLPIVNKTSHRDLDCYHYYPADLHRRVVSIFGPYMKKWNYSLPDEWGDITIPIISQWKFKVMEKLGNVCFQMGVVPIHKTARTR